MPAEGDTTWTCLACRQVCRCVRCSAPLGGGSNLFRRRDRRNNKDKREHKKRRVSDYDITKVIYHGVPMENVRVTSVSAKEIVIPTWRSSEPAARPSASPLAASPSPITSKSKKRSHRKVCSRFSFVANLLIPVPYFLFCQSRLVASLCLFVCSHTCSACCA